MSRFTKSEITLRIVLALIGLAIIFLGLNVGFGGIRTLGWQGPTEYLSVVDISAFNIQDNHIRFLGGVWLGMGVIFFASAFTIRRFKTVLIAFCGLIFIGGLSRLSISDPSILFSADISPSLFAEIFGFPLLSLWIFRTTKVSE